MVKNLTLVFAQFDLSKCDLTQVKNNSFFDFPVWWKYLKEGKRDGLGNCTPEVVFPNGIWQIGLAVLDMMLYLAGIVAVISFVVAGVMYVGSGGNAEQAAKARQRIFNSLIGLAIVLAAAGTVSLIGNSLG